MIQVKKEREDNGMYDTMKPEKRNFIIERILRVEWEMLQKVEGIGGRSGCQEDWKTFHIMRYSYYNAWPDALIRSYIKDLDEAVNDHRNLVMEKYAYMMEYSDPAYYKSNLEPYLPKIDDETRNLINEIADYLISCDKELAAKYPKLSRKGRPIEKSGDSQAETSSETYTRGELRTYTKYTLQFFADYIKKCKEEGINFAFLVKEKMVQMYGYASIDEAEAKL